jgi:hypothetical protein
MVGMVRSSIASCLRGAAPWLAAFYGVLEVTHMNQQYRFVRLSPVGGPGVAIHW